LALVKILDRPELGFHYVIYHVPCAWVCWGATEGNFSTMARTISTARPRDSAHWQWRHRDVIFSPVPRDLVTKSRSRRPWLVCQLFVFMTLRLCFVSACLFVGLSVRLSVC